MPRFRNPVTKFLVEQPEAIAGVLADPDVTAVHHYGGSREMETAIGRDIRMVTHTLGPCTPAGRRSDDGPAAIVTGIPEGSVDPRRNQLIGSRTLPPRTSSLPGQTNPRYTAVHTSDSEVKFSSLQTKYTFFVSKCTSSFQPYSLGVDFLLPYTVHNNLRQIKEDFTFLPLLNSTLLSPQFTCYLVKDIKTSSLYGLQKCTDDYISKIGPLEY